MSAGRTWSYGRGDWYAAVGPHVTVVLPPTERDRAVAVWPLVDDGAGFEAALDALVAAGLSTLSDLVLVAERDDSTRVLVRGSARVHLATADEVLLVEGAPATTWVERTATGVTRIRLELAADDGADEGADEGADDGADLDGRVHAGLVRLGSAELGPADPAYDASGLRPPTAPVSVASLDHDGLTRLPVEDPVDLLAPPAPGIPGQPPAPAVTSRPVARLLLPDGETVAVDRAILVGRSPEPARSSSADAPRLVSVPSPHQEVSSTHLEIRPGAGADHGAAVVTDLGSTNGTVVVQPGLPPEDLRPGVTVQLVPGAVVDLGDGVSIQVVGA